MPPPEPSDDRQNSQPIEHHDWRWKSDFVVPALEPDATVQNTVARCVVLKVDDGRDTRDLQKKPSQNLIKRGHVKNIQDTLTFRDKRYPVSGDDFCGNIIDILLDFVDESEVYANERCTRQKMKQPVVVSRKHDRAYSFKTPDLYGLMTSHGEALTVWLWSEGRHVESGDLKTALLSGDSDPNHRNTDDLNIGASSRSQVMALCGCRRQSPS